MMTEEEVKQDESIEHLKYLVDHFRKLANDKDIVIRQYMEILKSLKPSVDREEVARRKVMMYASEIERLKKEIETLKKRKSKKVSKDE